MIFGFAKSLTTNAQILREWAYSRVGMNGYLWLVGWVIILQAFWYTEFMWRLAKDSWTSVKPHSKLQWSPYRELSDWNAAVILQSKLFSSNILVTYTNNLTKNNYHTFFPCPALPLFLFHSVWWLPVEASSFIFIHIYLLFAITTCCRSSHFILVSFLSKSVRKFSFISGSVKKFVSLITFFGKVFYLLLVGKDDFVLMIRVSSLKFDSEKLYYCLLTSKIFLSYCVCFLYTEFLTTSLQSSFLSGDE